MDKMGDDELKKLILGVVKEENIKHAAHTAPVYSLSEILAIKSISELRKVGRLLHVKYYGKLPKFELIAAISESLQNTDVLRDLLYVLDETELTFFQNAASMKHLHNDKVLVDCYLLPQDLGLLQSFYYEDNLYFVAPKEIKSTIKKLTVMGFYEEKRFRDLLNKYAIAAVSLYGVISQDDFVALFNSQNKRQTNIDEMFSVLLTYVYMDAGYCFWDEYIVDVDFEEDDFDGVPALLEARKGKPRYAPPQEEFLKYSDWDYYEETPQLIALKQYLTDLIADPNLVLDTLDEIHDMCAAEVRMQECFDLLDSTGIVFDSMEQASKITQLIVDAQNNTRLWSNYGHTPNELRPVGKSNLIPFPSS
ncbi:MAG: Rho termination factor N-terminal domain-containing protein [Eubacteriales bacterium]|jgi:hypothetical protein